MPVESVISFTSSWTIFYLISIIYLELIKLIPGIITSAFFGRFS